jgi:hypothetical protein
VANPRAVAPPLVSRDRTIIICLLLHVLNCGHFTFDKLDESILVHSFIHTFHWQPMHAEVGGIVPKVPINHAGEIFASRMIGELVHVIEE